MYQKTVTLQNGALLDFEWEEGLANMTLKKDGAVVGAFNNSDELRQGRRFTLPDGQQVTVVYTEFGLEVWQNGEELVSGGTSASVEGFDSAVKGLLWLGGAQLVLAPVAYFLRSSSVFNGAESSSLEAAIGLIIAGGSLLGLGFWARQTGSKTPFWIGIVLGVLNIYLTISSGGRGGLFITAVLIYYLYMGTRSESPRPKRKPFSGTNAPLDSDL